MNQDYFPFPSLFIPRSDSLLHRLQHAPAPPDKDALPYLDQLMIFLEAPPPGVRDRWKKGAKMCTTWGFPCGGASVWRLHRSFAFEWRTRMAREANAACTDPPASLAQDTDRLTAHRTFEALANPHLPTEHFLALARLELRKKVFALAETRYQDSRQGEIDLALATLSKEIARCPQSRNAFNELRKILADQIAESLEKEGE